MERSRRVAAQVRRFGFIFALAACSGAVAEHPTPYGERPDIAQYIDALVAEHAFDRADLETLFAGAAQRQDIIDRISRPAEKVWSWGRYKTHLVDPARITKGVAFWAEHEQTLNAAAERYGVAPEYVVAVLGIETRYGDITGGFRVLDALTTLGFDYPPRADFFRKELTEFLLLAREEGKDPTELKGSYAGAMGYGQFIPSSYRHYAVDFDGDGLRDIWGNADDAIGSVANYFARHKWRGDGAVALRLEVDGAQLDDLANQGLKLRHSVADVRARGVDVPGVDAASKAALFKLEGTDGIEYWLGLHDFYVISRYNHSHLYALAVYELSQAIKAGRSAASVGR